MGRFRSYFSKNNTLIEDNLTNNSQNPVTEISYGTENAQVSRFIFNVNLEPLKEKIRNGDIKSTSITQHLLNITNTIRYRPDLLATRYYDDETERAASFDLELFTVVEDWDEGQGYDFVYIDEQFPNLPRQASNWTYRKTSIPWSVAGGFSSGNTVINGGVTATTGNSTVLVIESFPKGQENVYMDVTDIINQLIFTGATGANGTIIYGFGLKFPDYIESGTTDQRQAVAFHTKQTHTFFEPYVETVYDDAINDDRNQFYLDKNNELYLYSYAGVNRDDVTVNSVTIIDYNDETVSTIGTTGITEVRTGVYKITINVDSDSYPDAVLFTDRWNVTQNGKTKNIDQQFYLISQNEYYNYDLDNRATPDNYYFRYFGLKELEQIKRGDKRRVEIDTRSLYNYQDDQLPLELEYRIFVTQGNKYEIDVLPWTSVDRTKKGYEFEIDTSWLIPQDYFIELRMNSQGMYFTKEKRRFSVVSDGTFEVRQENLEPTPPIPQPAPETLPTVVSINILHYNNDTFFRVINIFDDDGNPYSLSGYSTSGLMEVKTSADSPTALATFTTTDSTMTISGNQIYLNKSPLSFSSTGVFVYDIELTGTEGIRTFVRGNFTVVEDISE